MYLVDTTVTRLANVPAIAGASIDTPRSGHASNAGALLIEGWILPAAASSVFVSVAAGTRMLTRSRADLARQDVAAAFPLVRHADRCGFRMLVDAASSGARELEVSAELGDGSVRPLFRIALEFSWRRGTHPAESGVTSVVIPSFDYGHFIGEAIESVLAQSRHPVEIVVIDDGSRDNTERVVARYPQVQYVRQENQGLAHARNAGIRQSNGEFLLFLDADDRITPNALETLVDALDGNPSWAFVSGEHVRIGVDGKQTADWTRPLVTSDHYRALLRGNYIACPAAVLYRRSALSVAGGFDPRYHPCEDYELALRIARTYPVGAIGSLVSEYRVHGASMSADSGSMLAAALRALGREEPYCRRDPALRQAYREGIRFWQQLYGAPMVEAIRGSLRTPQGRRSAIATALRLGRLAPGQLLWLATGRR